MKDTTAETREHAMPRPTADGQRRPPSGLSPHVAHILRLQLLRRGAGNHAVARHITEASSGRAVQSSPGG